MQPTVEEARRRIIEASERGEHAEFDDVIVLLREDDIVSQCSAIAVQPIINHVENHPRPAELHDEPLDRGNPSILIPSTARDVVLHALDSGAEIGPALGKWMTVDRAAEVLFRFTYQTLTAPDTVLHLSPEPGITVAA